MDRRNTLKYFLIVLGCLLGIVVFLVSYGKHYSERGKPTIEGTVAWRIAVVVQRFIGENQGRWPTNWNELTLSLDFCNRMLLENGKEVIPAIYVFTPTNLLKSDFRDGRVIVARCKPVKMGGRKGRYVIYERPDKEIWTDWVGEDEFQKMLKQSGVTLPAPKPTEARAAKEAVEKFIAKEEAEREIILKNAPKPTWGDIRAVWRERIKRVFSKQTDNGASGSSPGQSQGVQIRPVPVALATLLLLGIIFFAVRLWSRHKSSSAPPK